MADLTQFNLESAQRISRVVRKVEGEPPRAKPLSVDAVMESRQRAVVRVGTFTGSWTTNQYRTVTLIGRTNQTAITTVMALNRTFHLPAIFSSSTSTYSCTVAKLDGTTWQLISAPELNLKQGTFTAPWSQGVTMTVSLATGGSVVALNRHADILDSGSKPCTVGRDGMSWELVAADAPAMRICTFTGSWTIQQPKTITFVNQAATPNTAIAINLFASIPSDVNPRRAAVAREGTAWYLIAAEC